VVEQNIDVDELIDRISSKNPDIVEFRTDNLSETSILEVIAQKKKFAAIATDKASREPAAKSKLLTTAATAGFDFVDVDLCSDDAGDGLDQIKESGAKVIVSFHDWARTPSLHELDRILNSAKKRRADMYKIVTTAVRPRDNLTILSFLEEKSTETKLVSFAMGTIGIPSRVLSPMFGSEFTFAALNEESATAYGQLSIDNLRSAWSLLGLQ
jgi:3-dehydroquinate dehydratase type I